MNFSQSLDEPGLPFIRPNRFTTYLARIVELGSRLPLLANDDGADATTLESTTSEESDAAVTARAEIYGMRRGRGELTGSHPMDVTREDLIAKGSSEGRSQTAKIRT